MLLIYGIDFGKKCEGLYCRSNSNSVFSTFLEFKSQNFAKLKWSGQKR